jgi:hypothetical protein
LTAASEVKRLEGLLKKITDESQRALKFFAAESGQTIEEAIGIVSKFCADFRVYFLKMGPHGGRKRSGRWRRRRSGRSAASAAPQAAPAAS